MTVRTSKSQLRMKRICKHGVYWKRVTMSCGQEVISRRSKQRVKKVNQASQLSVESSHSFGVGRRLWRGKTSECKSESPWILEPQGMRCLRRCSHMSKSSARHHRSSLVAANGVQIKDLGEKSIPFKTNEGVQSTTFRSANVVNPLISMQKVVRAGNIVVLDEKNPHIRNTRDGRVIKVDVNNGVYTMDMWICLDETGPVFSWQGQ